jgi:membrane-associated phospholipid phosphatase
MFYSKHLKKNANKKIKYFSFIISQQSFLLFSFTLISGIGVNILKCIIGRARPCCLDSYGTFYLNGLSIDYDFLSFPSGHTATIFTMAYIFGIYAPKYRYIIYILASLIGISRIVTIDHYPSDVIAGGYLGLVIGKFCAIFFANKKIALNFKRTILEVRGKRFLKNQF